MLKRTMKYKDLEGTEHTEDFYFAINKREAIRVKLINHGVDGLDDKFTAIVKSGNPRLILDTFEEIVTMAYGRRSADGKSFEKKEEWTSWFIGTDAYDQLFERLVTDSGFAVEFIKGILPADMSVNFEQIDLPAELKATQGKPIEEMDIEELRALAKKNAANA